MGSSPSLAAEELQQVCQNVENVKRERLDNNVVACNKKGVFLTWKDLWVTVSGGKDSGKSILRGLTGYASPGHVLAIMGPSGCGKSTLLDALSGRLDSETKKTGEILLNGQRQQLAYGTSAYVTQDDILTWTLTVREIVYYSAQLQLPKSMSMTDKKERAERTIRDMGLQNCINTRIGGWGRKGLSSGEMRRVSICLEILTRPKLLFLDEPTSGLDSAASYHVLKQIINLARQYGMTVVAALHQPSSEVFKLLDNLCLLSLGRTMYFGPPSAANQFFEASGFSCPTFQNPADYYLNIINTDFTEDLELGIGTKSNSKATIDMLAESYRSSDTWKEILKQVSEISRREIVGMTTKEESSRGCFFLQCCVLTRRSFINMYRDMGYYWLRLAIYIALGFGLGTVFYSIGNSFSSINARGSMLMFVSSLLTIMAIGGFPSFIEEMKVFQRERLNGHYGVTAFIFSNAISSIPFLTLISVIPGTISYYLAGLHQGSGRFSYFSMVLFASIMLVESLMMIVASLVPNFLMGLVTGAGIQGLMMLSAGFFRLPDDLPLVFWRYPLYYISFHKYAYQGLYKNEFEGLSFSGSNARFSSSKEPSLSLSPPLIDGETVLRDFWEIEMGYSKWIDLAILFGMVFLYRLAFFCIIKNGERSDSVIVKTKTTLFGFCRRN